MQESTNQWQVTVPIFAFLISEDAEAEKSVTEESISVYTACVQEKYLELMRCKLEQVQLRLLQ